MFKKIADKYLKVIEMLSVILMVFILLCMVIQIVCRLFSVGQNFTEELARLCFSIMIFIAAPLCMAEGADICVDMVVNQLSEGIRRAVGILTNLLIALFSVIAFYSQIAVLRVNKGVTAVSMTWIKMNWLYTLFLISFIFLFIVAVWKIYALIKKMPDTYDINAEEKEKSIKEAKEMDLGI